MRQVLILIAALGHTASSSTEEPANIAQLITANVDNLASKLESIASELQQSNAIYEYEPDNTHRIIQDLDGIKTELDSWKDISHKEIGRLQLTVDTLESSQLEEIQLLKSDFKETSSTHDEEILELRKELAALKESASEDREKLLLDNSKLRAELSTFAARLNETNVKLENAGLKQGWKDQVEDFCQGMQEGFQVLEICPSGWLKYPGSSKCVKGIPALKDYQAALKHCREQGPGGDLVSIHSWEQFFFLKTKMFPYAAALFDVYIGLNDRRIEGVFEWTDSSPVDLTLWEKGEPNDRGGFAGRRGSNSDCVHLWGQKRMNWADTKCEMKYRFVCQLDSYIKLEKIAPLE